MKKQKTLEQHSVWSSIRSFLAGLAALTIGGFIGAGVALLYAPQSGRATRSMIYSKGVALKEKAAEEAHLAGTKAKGQLNHVTRDIRYKAQEVGSQAKGQLNHVTRDIRYKANEIGSRVQDAIGEGQSAVSSVLTPHNGR